MVQALPEASETPLKYYERHLRYTALETPLKYYERHLRYTAPQDTNTFANSSLHKIQIFQYLSMMTFNGISLSYNLVLLTFPANYDSAD